MSHQQKFAENDDHLVSGGKVMSLLDHLGELRGCVIRSLAAIIILFFVALYFSADIIKFLEIPLRAALGEQGKVLHFTGPLDVFLANIKVSLLTAVVFSCPYWIFQFWKFIEPALYYSERKYILPFVVASVGLFALGLSFSYFGILPLALEFLLEIGREVGTPIITVTDYLGLLTLMLFGFGLVFEAPLILILLGSLELVHSKTLAEYRRAVIVGVLVVGAILTPPDPLSQIGMAIPLYIMYELSIVIIRFMEKRRGQPFPAKTADV